MGTEPECLLGICPRTHVAALIGEDCRETHAEIRRQKLLTARVDQSRGRELWGTVIIDIKALVERADLRVLYPRAVPSPSIEDNARQPENTQRL